MPLTAPVQYVPSNTPPTFTYDAADWKEVYGESNIAPQTDSVTSRDASCKLMIRSTWEKHLQAEAKILGYTWILDRGSGVTPDFQRYRLKRVAPAEHPWRRNWYASRVEWQHGRYDGSIDPNRPTRTASVANTFKDSFATVTFAPAPIQFGTYLENVVPDFFAEDLPNNTDLPAAYTEASRYFSLIDPPIENDVEFLDRKEGQWVSVNIAPKVNAFGSSKVPVRSLRFNCRWHAVPYAWVRAFSFLDPPWAFPRMAAFMETINNASWLNYFQGNLRIVKFTPVPYIASHLIQADGKPYILCDFMISFDYFDPQPATGNSVINGQNRFLFISPGLPPRIEWDVATPTGNAVANQYRFKQTDYNMLFRRLQA